MQKGKEEMMENNVVSKKVITIVVLLLVAILSATVVKNRATAIETHTKTLETLDEKKATALKLTTAAAVTSTAISLIPGDAATPIAEQVSELTGPLLLVVCAIYLEKFLLTTMGYFSFGIIIPLACILAGISLFYKSFNLKSLAVKLLIFAIAIYGIIPASAKVMNLIEETFESSISATFDTVEGISEEADEAVAEEDSSGFMDFLTGIGEQVTGYVENAKAAVGIFIDAIAILLITTCLTPVVVVLLFVCLIKALFGLTITVPGVKIGNVLPDKKEK